MSAQARGLAVAPGVEGDQDHQSPEPADEDGIEAPESAVHPQIVTPDQENAMSQKPLHQCATCAAFLDGECINLVSLMEHGMDGQFRSPRPDDVCHDYEAEPDLLTTRLMRNLISGPA